jgi:hypothetical protein
MNGNRAYDLDSNTKVLEPFDGTYFKANTTSPANTASNSPYVFLRNTYGADFLGYIHISFSRDEGENLAYFTVKICGPTGTVLATIADYALTINDTTGAATLEQIVTLVNSYDLLKLFGMSSMKIKPQFHCVFTHNQTSYAFNELQTDKFIIEDSHSETKNLLYFDERTTKMEAETEFEAGTNAHLGGVIYQLMDDSGIVTKIVQMTTDVASGTAPIEGTNYKVLWPQTTDFTAISGYDAAAAQTLQHDATGAIKWVNNA